MKAYWDSLTKEQQGELAGKVGSTPGYLRLVFNGYKKASFVLAKKLEQCTSGAITKSDLRPDIAPLTPYDKWDGEKWVTDTEAQHSAAVEAAEAQRQYLIDAAMASISLIQLKLQAGRKLTQTETTRLNAVLDYIDAVTATDTSTAPDVIWPELPEA